MRGPASSSAIAGKRIAAALVDALYPKRCAGCERRGEWVCAGCEPTVPGFAPPWCLRCGAPPGLAYCRCDELPLALGAVRSAAPYDGWLRRAIIAYKYEGESGRADHLGAMLEPAVAALLPADALVPVPLHPRRQRERGFNQSALLARRAGAALGVPVVEVLLRTRLTHQQARLGAVERWANVAGAFAIAPGQDVRGRRLMLVDDVLTTGATLGACAEALIAGGAVSVSAATLAREA